MASSSVECPRRAEASRARVMAASFASSSDVPSCTRATVPEASRDPSTRGSVLNDACQLAEVVGERQHALLCGLNRSPRSMRGWRAFAWPPDSGELERR